jgi:hypothetical protein
MAKCVSMGWGIYHNQGFNKNRMGYVHFDKGIYHSQGFEGNMMNYMHFNEDFFIPKAMHVLQGA